MAYDEELAARVRELLADERVTEKKMFGGLTFMVDGHMCCGTLEDRLMVRVGAAAEERALALRGASPCEITGRRMTGLLWVDPAVLRTRRQLARWIERGLDHVRTLPARDGGRRRKR